MRVRSVGATERYETIGDAFYRDTGYLRPGKSNPIASGRDANDDENVARFENWCATKMVTSLVDYIVHLEKLLADAEEKT